MNRIKEICRETYKEREKETKKKFIVSSLFFIIIEEKR